MLKTKWRCSRQIAMANFAKLMFQLGRRAGPLPALYFSQGKQHLRQRDISTLKKKFISYPLLINFFGQLGQIDRLTRAIPRPNYGPGGITGFCGKRMEEQFIQFCLEYSAGSVCEKLLSQHRQTYQILVF